MQRKPGEVFESNYLRCAELAINGLHVYYCVPIATENTIGGKDVNPKLTQRLFDDFPLLYRNASLPPSQSALCFGIETDDGWEPLIRKLSEMLKRIEELTGHQTVASQVKEKFGILNFYHYTIHPEDKVDPIVSEIIDACVSDIEHRSAYTCERCGEFGELRKEGGWLTTLCTSHHKEYLAVRR